MESQKVMVKNAAEGTSECDDGCPGDKSKDGGLDGENFDDL